MEDGFLRPVQFVVVPVVSCSLILGLNSLEGSGRVERYTGRLLFLYVFSSTLAPSVGLLTALALRFGVGANVESTEAVPAEPAQPLSGCQHPAQQPVRGTLNRQLLQVILSAVLIGAVLGLLNEQNTLFVEPIRSIYEVSLKVLELDPPHGAARRICAHRLGDCDARVRARRGLLAYVLELVAAILVIMLLYAIVLLVAGAGAIFPDLLTGVLGRLRSFSTAGVPG